MKYEIDISPEDIGEIVMIIRIQHLKMHAKPFADKLKIKEKVLLDVENGSGPHGMLVLKKINLMFSRVDIKFNIELS